MKIAESSKQLCGEQCPGHGYVWEATVQGEAIKDCRGLLWRHLLGGWIAMGKEKAESSGNQ